MYASRGRVCYSCEEALRMDIGLGCSGRRREEAGMLASVLQIGVSGCPRALFRKQGKKPFICRELAIFWVEELEEDGLRAARGVR